MRLQQQSCWCVVLLVQLLGSGLSEGSLRNSFPFTEARPAKQGIQDEVPVDFQSVAAAGKQCIDKIVMEEETEYDEQYECDHSYSEQCTTSYTTVYEAQQEEECEENFQKDCFIEYAKTAYDVEVEICVEPLVKDCSVPGPEVCSTEYQAECETVQERHEVEDDVVECSEEVESKCEDVVSGYTSSQKCSNWPVQRCNVAKRPTVKTTPQTSCRQVAVELCGPSSCAAVAGPTECRQTTRTVTGEKPEEQCSLEPRRSCKHVTKLVPQLKPHQSCLDVPKEVCVRSQTNPRKVQKPVIKRWCYTPSEEAGLPGFASPPIVPDKAGSGQGSSLSNAQQCPQSCRQAQLSGTCDPRCNEYASICGTRPCQPPTTTTTTVPPPPTCPASCRPGYQTNGVCEPQCDVPLCGYDPDCDPVPYDPPPPPPPQPTPAPPPPPPKTTPAPPPPKPTPAPLGYLPPPPEVGRSALSPGRSLPLRPQFGRKLSPSVGQSRSSSARLQQTRPQQTRPQQARPQQRGGRRREETQQREERQREDTRPVRNNWDLYFRNGIIKRKTG